jgi:Zn-dependent protease with chaperone function
MSEDRTWEVAQAEWLQAWNQVRHFETMRGQWLGFFFTVIIGVLAVAGPRLDVGESASLALIAALAIALQLFSAALYLVVSRLNEVHTYNDRIIYKLRSRMRDEADVFGTIPAHPPAPPRAMRVGTLGTTKGVSEYVLFGSAAMLAVILGLDAIRALTTSGITAETRVFTLAAALFGVALVAFCWWIRRPGRTSSVPDDETLEPTAAVSRRERGRTLSS